MGAFTRTEILIVVRGHSQDTTLFIEVGPTGQLQRILSEVAGLVSYCIFQRIQVHNPVWHVDPNLDVVTADQEWRLWAWESQPFTRLQWDPREWQWRDPFAGAESPILFFRYSARLGRHILLARRQATPTTTEHWRREDLSHNNLTQFWCRL